MQGPYSHLKSKSFSKLKSYSSLADGYTKDCNNRSFLQVTFSFSGSRSNNKNVITYLVEGGGCVWFVVMLTITVFNFFVLLFERFDSENF